MSQKKNKWNVHGISFSGKEWLYEAAVLKSKRLRRSFSNYVCGLLEDDLAKEKSSFAEKARPETGNPEDPKNYIELNEKPIIQPAEAANLAALAAADKVDKNNPPLSRVFSQSKPAKRGPRI